MQNKNFQCLNAQTYFAWFKWFFLQMQGDWYLKKIFMSHNYIEKYFIDASMSNFWTCSKLGDFSFCLIFMIWTCKIDFDRSVDSKLCYQDRRWFWYIETINVNVNIFLVSITDEKHSQWSSSTNIFCNRIYCFHDFTYQF